MSAFLGNIHFWLYNKIQIEETILDEIILYVNNKGYNSAKIYDEAILNFGKAERGELEDVIDQGNIHGWLQSKIASVESRIAFILTGLLKENVLDEIEINHIFQKQGEITGRKVKDAVKTSDYSLPQGVFNLIYDNLLAGMPCDRVNEVITNDNEKIVWRKSIDVHKQYWENVNGDVAVFHNAINTWTKGFVSNFNSFRFYIDDKNYSIERR
ncbi:MAG: hypothetical protein ACK5LY_03160 [Lachnospirales bacterium]